MERLGAALESCGWRRRGAPSSSAHQLVHASKYLFEHSVHYIHDEWPCDLDIHYNFPGFLAPDDVVFEELWARRATVEVAHWPVPCPDLLGQLLIVALPVPLARRGLHAAHGRSHLGQECDRGPYLR